VGKPDRKFWDNVQTARERLLALDYDGTLALFLGIFSRVTSGIWPCPNTSVTSRISIPTSFSSGPMFSAISSFSLTVRHSYLPSISRI